MDEGLRRTLELAALAVASDFQLGSSRLRLSETEIDQVATALSDFDYPLVYTAFDGDHFSLTDQMRLYCIKRNLIPVHPESILGYYETLSARQTKAGVLRDDLALLQRCDEIMVFTDIAPELDALSDLAEGVLVELCFFMLLNPGGRVSVVAVEPLILQKKEDPVLVEWSAAEVLSALAPELRDDILAFLGGESLSNVSAESLPAVAYAITDVLDSKYYRWIRPYSMTEQDTVTVVPGLAVDVSDCLVTTGGPVCLLVSWSRLMRLATEAFVFEPMNKHHGIGNVHEILRRCWNDGTDRGPSCELTWEQLKVPKAILGDAWPISPASR